MAGYSAKVAEHMQAERRGFPEDQAFVDHPLPSRPCRIGSGNEEPGRSTDRNRQPTALYTNIRPIYETGKPLS